MERGFALRLRETWGVRCTVSDVEEREAARLFAETERWKSWARLGGSGRFECDLPITLLSAGDLEMKDRRWLWLRRGGANWNNTSDCDPEIARSSRCMLSMVRVVVPAKRMEYRREVYELHSVGADEERSIRIPYAVCLRRASCAVRQVDGNSRFRV